MTVPRIAESSELTDAEVVRLAQQGDATAFERIYRSHARRVYAICLRMAGNATEAEDLTQDVFLQLFRKLNTFRGESAFSTWLHRMSVNIVLMRFRKKKLSETSFDEFDGVGEPGNTLPQEFGVRDLRLNGVIDRITLQAAINELAPGYKAMFILYYVQGYKHNEIAEMFGCSVGNSKSQVHKARVQLRELLQKARKDNTRRHRNSPGSSLLVHGLNYAVDYANG